MTPTADPSDRLKACVLCPRRCGADRTGGTAKAACGIGRLAKVHRWGPGADGDGAIVFAGCSLRCLHCPTAAAAWDAVGDEVAADRLAAMLSALQALGCRAVTLVNPGHVAVQVVEALAVARAQGFTLPLAWRSAGYDGVDALRMLDGAIDSYTPDVKLADPAVARVCLGVRDYGAANRAAVMEMHRQVGDRLVVRHLVLPNGLSGTEAALSFLPAGTMVRVVAGYRPAHRAAQHPKLSRRPTPDEIERARTAVVRLGLRLAD